MKTHSHYAIRKIKSLLDTISMMDIDIEIQYSRINFKKLENAKHNIVDVAKSTSLTLFSMVETTSPVDSNISITIHDGPSTANWASSRQLTKIIEAVEGRTVEWVTNLECLPQLHVIHQSFPLFIRFGACQYTNSKLLIMINNAATDVIAQIFNVLRRVKFAQLIFHSLRCFVHIHLVVEMILHDETVSHGYSFRPHWMVCRVDIATDLATMKVGHSPTIFWNHNEKLRLALVQDIRSRILYVSILRCQLPRLYLARCDRPQLSVFCDACQRSEEVLGFK